MNPIVAVALIALAGAGLAMFLRKRNTVTSWLEAYWGGYVDLPQDFERAVDVCVYLVDYGIVPPSQLPGFLRIITSEDAEVCAVRDGVVTWVGTVPGFGSGVGISHLFTDRESTLYVGLAPLIGLGQFVHGDDVIGTMIGATELVFKVYASRVPDPANPNLPVLEPRAWLRARGTAVSPQER